jgi:hypothetical protein
MLEGASGEPRAAASRDFGRSDVLSFDAAKSVSGRADRAGSVSQKIRQCSLTIILYSPL